MSTIEDISKYAAKQIMPEEELSIVEWLLYYRLKDIYNFFTSKKINKHEGEIYKKQALKQYEMDKKFIENAENITQAHQKMWDRIALASIEYNKNPCVETADLFVKAVYGDVDRKEEIKKYEM